MRRRRESWEECAKKNEKAWEEGVRRLEEGEKRNSKLRRRWEETEKTGKGKRKLVKEDGMKKKRLGRRRE